MLEVIPCFVLTLMAANKLYQKPRMFSETTSRNATASQSAQVSGNFADEAAYPSSSPLNSAHPFVEKDGARSPTATPKKAYLSLSRNPSQAKHDSRYLTTQVHISQTSHCSADSFDPLKTPATTVDGFPIETVRDHHPQGSTIPGYAKDEPLTWAEEGSDDDASIDSHAPQTELSAKKVDPVVVEMQSFPPPPTAVPLRIPRSSEEFFFVYTSHLIFQYSRLRNCT